MSIATVFKRHEIKYRLSRDTYLQLKEKMSEYMKLDKFGRHTIHNIYFDTPSYLLIRRSIEKPSYKEKLRVRCYGNYEVSQTAFVEMKKKYNGIVYKRRLKMNDNETRIFLQQNKFINENSQIGKEIKYFIDYYKELEPKVAIHYEREAYYGIDNEDFRMTFDHNICMETNNISFVWQEDAQFILEDDSVILEVKTATGMPRWLLDFFNEHEVYKTSFSKYGTGYRKFILKKTGGSNGVA